MAEKLNTEPLLLAGAVGGDFDHLDVAFGLAGREDPVTVRLASDGGQWAAGIVIANQLRERAVRIEADFAGSAAVAILLAGDHRVLAADGYVHLHCGWSACVGNAADMRGEAAELEAMDRHQAEHIAARTKLNEAEALALLRTEPRLTPEKALELDFIHEIGPAAGTARPPLTAQANHEAQRAVRAGQMAALYARDDLSAMNIEAGHQAARVDPTFAANRKAAGTRRSDGAGRRRLAGIFERRVTDHLRRAYAIRDGRPVPEFEAGAWRCEACRRTNHHPPATDAGPSPCAWCGTTDNQPPTEEKS